MRRFGKSSQKTTKGQPNLKKERSSDARKGNLNRYNTKKVIGRRYRKRVIISRSLASTEDSASSYFRFGKKTCKNSDKSGGGDDDSGFIAVHSASKFHTVR